MILITFFCISELFTTWDEIDWKFGVHSQTEKVPFMGLFLLLWKPEKINILWLKRCKWYYILWFMSLWHLDKSIFPGGFLSLNVYPKFSVEFWWVKRRCSYHPFHAVYSPINHPETPSKNLYFRENFGSKFVGDDNLIFHAVCRVTDENEERGKKLSFRDSLG